MGNGSVEVVKNTVGFLLDVAYALIIAVNVSGLVPTTKMLMNHARGDAFTVVRDEKHRGSIQRFKTMSHIRPHAR